MYIEAISDNEEVNKAPEPQVESTAPKKKKLPKTDDTIQATDQGVPVYSQPPFWAKQTVEFDEDGNELTPASDEPPVQGLENVEAAEASESSLMQEVSAGE